MQSDNQLDSAQSYPQNFEDLSFDDWSDLHETDPELFDEFRKKLLNDLVDSAPERSKARLRGLIFQMEAEAISAKSPMAYNMRLAAMMTGMMGELSLQINRLVESDCQEIKQDQTPVNSATVLSFHRNISSDKNSD